MNDLPSDRATPFVARRELLPAAIVALATLLVCVYFAPRGFRAGFTDMAHDGYQLRQVLDLDAGGVIFKDTFDQYGPLSGYLNLAGYRLFGHTWLAVKYTLGLWYAAIAILMYRIARHLLAAPWSAAAVVIWLALAPFYQHGVMVTPHAYILFFQAVGTLALIRYAETEHLKFVAIAGVCCGICWALKTTMGVLFAAAAFGYLASGPLRSVTTLRRSATALATLLAFSLLVAAATLGWLWMNGALHDWYVQTVVFPRSFYLDERSAQAPSSVSFPVIFAINFLLLNFGVTGVPVPLYWHLMRATVVVGAVILSRRRAAPEALLVIAALTPVLWLAAYPSANFMHQWWTASLTIPAFVYCVRLAVHGVFERLPRIPIAGESWLTAAVLVMVFWSSAGGRIQATRERTAVLTETLDVPRVLKGIRTDKPTSEAFHAIYAAMVNFKQHHPTARVISNDHCDGFSTNCVADSLLWLSFLDDNRHDHPIYWPMSVLSTTLYPDYKEKFTQALEQSSTLVVDSWAGVDLPDNGLDGYQLLVGIRTPLGYWYVFSPDHPGTVAHGEVTTRLDQSGQPAGIRQVSEYGLRRQFDEALEPATGATRKLPLYTWPAVLDVPPLREPERLDLTAADLHDKDVAGDGDRWIVRGVDRPPYEALLGFKERLVARGEYFFATGTLTEGACRFMLFRDNDPAGYVDILKPGPFAVVLAPPRPGRYRLEFTTGRPVTWLQDVQTHGLSGFMSLVSNPRRPIAYDVDRAGWVTRAAESPVALVYQQRGQKVQLDSDERLREEAAAAERAEAEELREEARLADERRALERQGAVTESDAQAAARELAADPGPEPDGPVPVFGARRNSRHVLVDFGEGHVPLYTWPAGIHVPEPLPRPAPLDDTTLVQREVIAKAEPGRWIVRGSAQGRYSYLLTFREQAVERGGYFVATGTMSEGGFTLGLQQDQKWVGMVNVEEPGPFAIVLRPVHTGSYTLVLANNVTESTSWELIRRHWLAGLVSAVAGEKLPNDFEMERAGWILRAPRVPADAKSASGPKAPDGAVRATVE